MPRIKEEVITEITIEKSRFITYLSRAMNEEEARAYFLKIRKLHPSATHHCTAYITGEHNEYQKSSDDGEPSGTAGIPMLECLRKNQMQNVAAVVVRYFGGIKLGAGGLIRAYSKSVSTALSQACFTQIRKVGQYQCDFDYELIGPVDTYFIRNKITIQNKEFNEMVHYIYLSEHDISKELLEITKGKIKIHKCDDIIIEV